MKIRGLVVLIRDGAGMYGEWAVLIKGYKVSVDGRNALSDLLHTTVTMMIMLSVFQNDKNGKF